MDQWHQLQGLSLETKVGLAAAIIVPTIAAIVAFIQWRITENRVATYRRDDRQREAEQQRTEQERRNREEQRQLIATQAILTLTRTPDKRPIGVGSASHDRMLVGTLWNIGMSDASVVRVSAYLNGVELPRWGSWAQQQRIRVGDNLGIRYILPFKVEPPDQRDGPWLDEALADATVRIDVQFNDASAPDRRLSFCYRFDRAPYPTRWEPREVEC